MIGHLTVLLYFSAFVSGIPALIYATQIKNVYSVAFLKYYRLLLIAAASLVLIDGVRAYVVTNIGIDVSTLSLAHALLATPAECAVVLFVLMSSVYATRMTIPRAYARMISAFTALYASLLMLEYFLHSGVISIFLDVLFLAVLASALVGVYIRRDRVPQRIRPKFIIFAYVSVVFFAVIAILAVFFPIGMPAALTAYFVFWCVLSGIACRSWSRSQYALRTNISDGAAKKFGITRSQRRVADLICMGLGNIEIADALGTETQSVANTVSALIRKAGAKSRSELIRMLSGI